MRPWKVRMHAAQHTREITFGPCLPQMWVRLRPKVVHPRRSDGACAPVSAVDVAPRALAGVSGVEAGKERSL